jgi:hypothetical protein
MISIIAHGLLARGPKGKVCLLKRSSENLLKGMGETLNVASEASFEAKPSE